MPYVRISWADWRYMKRVTYIENTNCGALMYVGIRNSPFYWWADQMLDMTGCI